MITEPAQFLANAGLIASLANKRGLPTIGAPSMAALDSLIGYGLNFPELFRSAATFFDKILKGAKPGDLPIQRGHRGDRMNER